MTGAATDELRYMERKGLVTPVKAQLGKREVRQYTDADVRRAGLIIKYRRQGFTWDTAAEKATPEVQNPTLF